MFLVQYGFILFLVIFRSGINVTESTVVINLILGRLSYS